jgi:hypothetical protein
MVLISAHNIEQFIGTTERYTYCIKIMKDTALEYLKCFITSESEMRSLKTTTTNEQD